MLIQVVAGQGEGQTLLSAFDAALKSTGVYNYNLLHLSSCIPPAAEVHIVDRYQSLKDQFGHKLYVVIAETRSNEFGKIIGAGLGWYQFADGRGIFVEHTLSSHSAQEVREKLNALIRNSLQDLCGHREIPFLEENMHAYTSLAVVQNRPTCVLAMAVYEAEPWNNPHK